MDVIALADGTSWSVREGGREVGLVLVTRPGRAHNIFYAPYSGKVGSDRWDLGTAMTLEAAVERVEAFHADPASFGRRVHKVAAEAVERRR